MGSTLFSISDPFSKLVLGLTSLSKDIDAVAKRLSRFLLVLVKGSKVHIFSPAGKPAKREIKVKEQTLFGIAILNIS